MTKKSVYFFVLCSSPLLPAFSRFSFGIVFALDFCLLFLAMLGARKLFSLCGLNVKWASAVELASLLLCSELYSGVVKLAMPLEAFALGFFISLAPLVYFLFDALLAKCGEAEDTALSAVLTAAAFPTALSIFRELLCFGSVTLPSIGSGHTVQIIPQMALEFTRFFGSLPGSLIALGLFIWLMNSLTANDNDARGKAALPAAEDSSSM